MGRPLELADLFRLREAADPQLAPGGATVAFVVTWADEDSDANRSQIWIAPTSDGDARPLTRAERDSHPRWSPDGTRLAFLRREGDDPSQVWVLPPDGGEARKLTSLPLGVGSFAWSPDSTRLAAAAPVDIEGEPATDAEKERRKSAPVVVRSAAYKADGTGLLGTRRNHLFVIDAENGEAQELTKNDTNAAMPSWSPDGRTIAFVASLEDRDVTSRTHLFAVDAGGGAPEEIARWQGTAAAPVFTPDGASVVFVGSQRVGVSHSKLFTVDAAGGVPAELVQGFDRNVMIGAPAYPGAPPVFGADGNLRFCARDRGCTNVYAMLPSGLEKVAGDGERVCSGLSVAGELMAYVVSSPSVPADVYVAGPDGDGERRLTELNGEWLAEVELHRAVERAFTAPDGLEIHGWVLGNAEMGPLLVDIHGGPHNAWSPAFDAVHLYHELLAHRGWNILRLNPRGSDGYGEDFYTAVVAKWGEVDEQDFLCAVDALVADGTADPSRVAVCGYSYGGHMTNWLTARSDRFKAAVSGGSICNYASFYGNSDLGYWVGAFEVGAELHEARDRFAELSPLSYVEGVAAPTLILHGENDQRCPVGQAEEWFIALRRRGVDCELVRYPGASHLFILSGRPSHRIDYNQRIADWLTRYI